VITTPAREARPRRLTSTLLWAAQILLAAFFVFGAAVPKLTGSHQMLQEFGLIGAGQWLRYLVGTAELAGAIGLVTPWLAGLAAVGLAADMAGATIINATVLHSTTFAHNVWMTAVPLCRVRGPRLQSAAADQGPGGSHRPVTGKPTGARHVPVRGTEWRLADVVRSFPVSSQTVHAWLSDVCKSWSGGVGGSVVEAGVVSGSDAAGG
jgi:uncharacterized membrane protein YphA (DoxX/SURF4 family)